MEPTKKTSSISPQSEELPRSDSRAGHGGLDGNLLKITSVITFQGSLGRLTFGLSDGRTISIPTAWNEKIDAASDQILAKFKIIEGMSVKWPSLGVVITLQELLHPYEAVFYPSPTPSSPVPA